MKLIKVRTWIDKNFVEGSKPTPQTVYQWIRDGEIPGALLGNSFFIDDNYSFKNFSTRPIKKQREELGLPEPKPEPYDLDKKLRDAGVIS